MRVVSGQMKRKRERNGEVEESNKRKMSMMLSSDIADIGQEEMRIVLNFRSQTRVETRNRQYRQHCCFPSAMNHDDGSSWPIRGVLMTTTISYRGQICIASTVASV